MYFLFNYSSKGGKLQKRGKINLIGRLQLTTEKTKEEDNESIVALRVLRTQVHVMTYNNHNIVMCIYTVHCGGPMHCVKNLLYRHFDCVM